MIQSWSRRRCIRLITLLGLLSLFATVGGAGEPVLLKDVWPGSYGSQPGYLMRFGDEVLFGASDGISGHELWRTDGTEAGTLQIQDIVPGAGSGIGQGGSTYPWPVGIELDDFFLFSAGQQQRELWRTDGTSAGTYRLVDDYYGSSGNGFYRGPSAFSVLDGVALFGADADRTGNELWRSDGTEYGTSLVQEIGQQLMSGSPRGFTVLGGQAIFVARHVVWGTELYITDGTEIGTRLLKDINPIEPPFPAYAESSNPANLTLAGDLVFFSANDEVHGRELWVTDGTPEGTQLVMDVRPGVEGAMYGSGRLIEIVAGGPGVYFVADDGEHGRELWASDGTEAGTYLVKDIAPGPADAIRFLDEHNSIRPDASPAGLDGRAYFVADDGTSGAELWISDGTEAGTALVQDIRPGPEGSTPRRLGAAAGRLFFAADDGEHGMEPYSSDGTDAGTFMLGDLRTGPESSAATGRLQFIAIGNRVVFHAYDDEHGLELWVAVVPPLCHGRQATVFVDESGTVRGGALDGQLYSGVLQGSGGNDVIVGTDVDDVIQAHAGDDIVCGGDGHDRIHGHHGDDLLDGGEGRNILSGGPGSNDCIGGTDNRGGSCWSRPAGRERYR